MPDPNNIILHDRRICLALPCKAANTSIKLGLAHHLGLVLPKPDDPPQFGVHNAGLFDYTSLEAVPDSYTVVGVMREPLARIVSSWRFTAAPHQSFRAWVRRMAKHSDHEADQHVRSQSYDLMVRGKWRPNLMVYVEHLDEDWAAFEHFLWSGRASHDQIVLWGGGRRWEHFELPHANTLEENGCVRRELDGELNEPGEVWNIIWSRWAADFLAYDQFTERRITRVFGRFWVDYRASRRADDDKRAPVQRGR